MTKAFSNMTSVSALLGAAVADAGGGIFGHVREFAVCPPVNANHVEALVLRPAGSRRGELMLAPVQELERDSAGGLKLRPGVALEPLPKEETYLMLERDLLDQQIIDIHGHKVVRVNDVELVWEIPAAGEMAAGAQPDDSRNGAPEKKLLLRIAQVEVGTRGAIRRLLKGLPPITVDRIAHRFRTTAIPWEFVDLIDRDPSRRVRLKIEQDRLAKMHPSDLADILEELAPAERQALFTSLDEEVAAEALEEVEPKMQKALIESLDSGRVADIVEEMDPAAAADFLAELPDERSEAILEEMEPEDRQDVEELMEFTGDNAAGEMTTDYISLSQGASVEEAINVLRDFQGDLDRLTHIFLVDEEEILRGVVPLVKVLLAARDGLLSGLAEGHIVSCHINTSAKKVAELFDKYNLRALPVVDEEKKLAGVIYAEQVIAQLRTAV